MTDYKVLFKEGRPIGVRKISKAIKKFGKSYADTVQEIIEDTDGPNLDKTLFLNNCAMLLTNFKMTRAGIFKGVHFDKVTEKVTDRDDKLEKTWDRVGKDLISLKGFLTKANLKPRSRTLLLLDEASRKDVVGKLWSIFKKLLPITMSSSSYGLVGASKILFSLFPEVALPIDNTEWRKVFRTVDFGDVIHRMAEEVSEWEKKSGILLDSLDQNNPTTLPAVYNVMAMEARRVKKK